MRQRRPDIISQDIGTVQSAKTGTLAEFGNLSSNHFPLYMSKIMHAHTQRATFMGFFDVSTYQDYLPVHLIAYVRAQNDKSRIRGRRK
jgi:hypothetical protein